MFSTLFTFLRSPKAKLMLAIIVLCSAFVGGWQARDWQCVATVADIRAEHAASLAEAHQKARWHEKRYQTAADQAGEYHSQLKMAQQRAKESIQVEQDAYVTTTNRFPIPAQWVFNHNYAACRVSGASEATCRADAATGIARDDQALKTITNNYVTCSDWKNALISWQKLYGGLK